MLLSFAPLLLSLTLANLASCYPNLAGRATSIDHVSQLKHAYDYVVIGGGTSGLTVANRLTEDGKGTSTAKMAPRVACADQTSHCTVTVLVLEYGYVYGPTPWT